MGRAEGTSYPPIGDYAVIGDCRSAALINKDGALEWLCLPRFDSPSVFAAILDRGKGGRFRIGPTGEYSSSHGYLGRTNVLQTTFRTAGGELRVTDLMPVASEEEKRDDLWPDHEVLRVVECVRGEVEVELECDVRPEYGARRAWVSDRGKMGIHFEYGNTSLVLRTELEAHVMEQDGGGVARGAQVLRAGERRRVSLAFNYDDPAVIPALGASSDAKLERSQRWWEAWARRCAYQGPYRDQVVRSALALKLMTFAPSGAVVAAPTTSLPEEVGGVRNWDYRYCWLRDAALTLRSLLELGYHTEADAFLDWLMHATQLTRPRLQVMYGVFGETRMPERELEHLEGYRGSRPVRVGNRAAEQLQLDVYGGVIQAAYDFCARGGELDRSTSGLLVGLGRTICGIWREPDEGIWEVRTLRAHHTFSKVMCWVGLQRLLELHEAGRVRAPVERFVRERDAIRAEVDRRGYSESLGSYVATLDGEKLDASALQISHYGYDTSERMRSTVRRVYETLGRGSLLYRYVDIDDGVEGGEGAFGICCFWGVEALAELGEVEEARRRFEEVCAHASDAGLFAEEIDPVTGAALGNYPQAFTHIGLINAALTIEEASGRREPRHELTGGERV